MTGDKLENFRDLYEKIAALKVVKCRLNHERILFDKETDLPIADCLPELGYKNVGLCSPEIRRERVACGHTMARYLLEDALALLVSNGVDTEDLNFELREVTDRIHSLDHEKGFAEKHLAQLVEKKYAGAENDLTVEIEKAKFSIKEIEDFHSDCVEKIGKVRDSIISEMQLFL